ncbi:MAG TPA: recombinase family protein, partial [Gemmataceae bacterium]|nr:recombinase family protein [Gemmataceae bacterium]
AKLARPMRSKIMPQPLSYSYIRFSGKSQEKGDSLDRQTLLRDAYPARYPAPPLDTELTLRDLGVSAFRGKNALIGNLRLFLDAIADKRVAPGSRLIVESLDRISRQGIDEGYDLCKRILKAGVHIVTLSPERDFGPEAVKGLTKGALELQLILERAAEESETKSKRVSAAWTEKKRRARAGEAQHPTERMGSGCQVLTRRLPLWVERVGGRLVKVPARATAVKHIFALAAAGLGHGAIVKRLEAESVPPFGKKRWHKGYVGKILKDRRAVGEHQPRKGGRPDGDSIPDYFPAAVTEEEWLAARAGAEPPTRTGRGSASGSRR